METPIIEDENTNFLKETTMCMDDKICRFFALPSDEMTSIMEDSCLSREAGEIISHAKQVLTNCRTVVGKDGARLTGADMLRRCSDVSPLIEKLLTSEILVAIRDSRPPTEESLEALLVLADLKLPGSPDKPLVDNFWFFNGFTQVIRYGGRSIVEKGTELFLKLRNRPGVPDPFFWTRPEEAAIALRLRVRDDALFRMTGVDKLARMIISHPEDHVNGLPSLGSELGDSAAKGFGVFTSIYRPYLELCGEGIYL